jgi:hypothetical protein
LDEVRNHPGLLLPLVAALPVAVGEVRLEVAMLPVKKTARRMDSAFDRDDLAAASSFSHRPLKLCRLALVGFGGEAQLILGFLESLGRGRRQRSANTSTSTSTRSIRSTSATATACSLGRSRLVLRLVELPRRF